VTTGQHHPLDEAQQHRQPQVPPIDTLALGALILGIAGMAVWVMPAAPVVLVLLVGNSALAAPLAVVLGVVALKRIRRTEGQVRGRSLAGWGIALGIIGSLRLALDFAFIWWLIGDAWWLFTPELAGARGYIVGAG
jgi:hypothetical protein